MPHNSCPLKWYFEVNNVIPEPGLLLPLVNCCTVNYERNNHYQMNRGFTFIIVTKKEVAAFR